MLVFVEAVHIRLKNALHLASLHLTLDTIDSHSSLF